MTCDQSGSSEEVCEKQKSVFLPKSKLTNFKVTLKMKSLFALTLLKFSNAFCAKFTADWEECRNWAAYMPCHYWTYADDGQCLLKREGKTEKTIDF